MERERTHFKKGDEIHLDTIMGATSWERDCFEKKDGEDMSDWEICTEEVIITVEYPNREKKKP
jgi:hypothetical protein